MERLGSVGGTFPATEDVVVFVTIAQEGSLNAAARTLKLPKSTLSRRLLRLEESVGVTLFARHRQQLRLTEIGITLLEQAKVALQELRALADAASLVHEEPRGRLRVTMPRDLASYRNVWLDFMERYPKVALEVELTNQYVDLVRDRYDLALRGGRGDDDSLVAKRVGAYHLIAVAGASYAQLWGVLDEPTRLRQHSCILLSALRPRPGYPDRPNLPHRHIIFNDAELALHAARRGLGIAILPAPMVDDDLRAGRLVKMVNAYDPLEVPLYAVYPARTYMRGVVKTFIEFVEDRFSVTNSTSKH